MLYGVHGIGKSTFANQSDKPIFISTEDGLNDLDCERFPLCENYAQVMDCLKALWSEQHGYQTVVIDSLDWLERIIWAEVCRRESAATIEKVGGGYGKGYTRALDVWREVLDGLEGLRAKHGMSSILLAHASITRYESPETESYDRYTPRLQKHASGLVQEWCDEVLFATYKTYVKTKEEHFGRTTYRAVGGQERIMRTCEKPYCEAKNRLGLPEELPLSYAEYAKYFPTTAADKPADKQADKPTLATTPNGKK